MRKTRLSLIRGTTGSVWHLLTDKGIPCGAALRNTTTIAGDGSPRDVIQQTKSVRLPLCPMCF